MASTSTSSSSADTGANPRDPSGYLTSSTNPSTVVKVVGTGRDDINGLLGIVVSYNVERERYLVHVPVSQSTMALKKENLQKATFIESYRAQWQQLRNDPRVKEKMNHYKTWCEQQVQPFKLTHVVGAVLTMWVGLWFLFGFTKTVMVTSILLLLLVIVAPDLIVQRCPPKVVLQRFPMRAREILEQQMPFLRGRLTDKMATITILFLVLFCVQSLFFTGGGKSSSTTQTTATGAGGSTGGSSILDYFGATTKSTSGGGLPNRDLLQAVYNSGFQDATMQRVHGFSFQTEIDTWLTQQRGDKMEPKKYPSRVNDGDDNNDGSVDPYSDLDDPLFRQHHNHPPPSSPPPPPSFLSKLMRFSTLGSVFFVYRLVKDKGTDQTTGLFSVGQLAANLQHNTEVWQQGMLLYSLYNIVTTVLF